MQNLQSYDTTTQAMTEVALALSMAFFALLIVALLSFQVPQQKNALAADGALRVNDAEKIQIENASASSTKTGADSEQEPEQVVFFYQDKFVDQQLKPLALSNLQHSQTRQTLVLAVPARLRFSEVMAVRNKINHPNLSITLISKEWQTLLERKL
jgi:hypothetical protein